MGQRTSEPKCDRECWRSFVDRILRLDTAKRVSVMLQEHKRLVMALVEDQYLNDYFWQEPSASQAGPSRKTKCTVQTWYVEGRWAKILDELLDRIYLMRCQLVHGAATYGSQLNRTALQHCVWMLTHLVNTFLTVWIEFGADEDWGPMCYPPQNSQGRAPHTNGVRRQSAK